MKLNQLLAQVEGVFLQNADPDITGVAYDSRKVEPGNLFVCISGFKTDGHLFIEAALTQGAKALVVERPVEVTDDVAVFQVSDARRALPWIAANFYKHPSRDLKLIGVTGTNGKTTVTHILQNILSAAGYKTGILGTLYAKIGDKVRELEHTTPEAPEIEKFLAECRGEGADYVVMEVSSHALALDRTAALNFHAAVFTNLTQDHLDYHHNMKSYLAAKLKLFKQLSFTGGSYGVVNADDAGAEMFKSVSTVPVLTYGMNADADVRATDVDYDLYASTFKLRYNEQDWPVKLKLIGDFNVYNALAASTVLVQENLSPAIIIKTLSEIRGVPGRFEAVRVGQNFNVVVDYAHTPDGLFNILQTARQITKGDVILVFGCGGDRDPGKRPKMGRIAEANSDFFIITSDNPRSEEPRDIIREIESGLKSSGTDNYFCEPDRSLAIRKAVERAQDGDIVIIAGKGHETYQILKDKTINFDDREVARKWLKMRLKDES